MGSLSGGMDSLRKSMWERMGSDTGQRSHRIIARTGWYSLTGSVAMNRLTGEKPHRGDEAQPGISLVDEIFSPAEGRVFVSVVPPSLCRCHISCSFPLRDPPQKIIYIQLGSLKDFEMSRTLPAHKTGLPPQIRRLPPLASAPSSSEFSHQIASGYTYYDSNQRSLSRKILPGRGKPI